MRQTADEKQRSILHVDMDAFYASVEQRDSPELRNKPLVVGGGSNRGVVAAASYEARKYGIRSAMPMREAYRRCPQLLRVAPRMSLYKQESDRVFEVFRSFTPLVEGLSLDEAFLDVTGSLSLFGSSVEIANRVKQQIFDETSLRASVGVAPNKLVAKICSDLDKPDGLVVVTTNNMREVLDPLPVRVIPGIGRETLAQLTAVGISTIRDLRTAPDRNLESIFGRFAQRTRDRASGIDQRAVNSSSADKSISAEETFDTDLNSVKVMHRELLRLTDRTATRLRAKSLVAGTIQLKVRQSDFSTYTRQRALHPPGNNTDQIYELTRSLLATWLAEFPGSRIRLLGVGGSDLMPDGQQDLFADDPGVGGAPVDETVDQIRERFGSASVGRARTLD
jgi:DNA polymerase-4